MRSAPKRQRREGDHGLSSETFERKRLGGRTSKGWNGITRDVGPKAEEQVMLAANRRKQMTREEGVNWSHALDRSRNMKAENWHLNYR